MNAPSFFSLDFHARFFPAVLRAGWRRFRMPVQHSPFHNHVPIEFTVLAMIFPWVGVFGLAGAFQKHSIGWGIIGGLGIAGFLALLFVAIRSQRGVPPSWDEFRPSVFFFFAVLGMSAGLFTGFINHSPGLECALAPAGLMIGYMLGIGAGLGIQKLGPMSFLLILAAWFGLVILIGTDLCMITVFKSKIGL